jgi:TIR domain
MGSLADLPKLIGFFSYSRNDDEGDDGAVLALANRIYRELRTQLGRTNENFKLWRDKDALAAGEHWKEKLKEAVSESVFFIQMVTPSAVNSHFCRFEFESFIEREKELGRNDLVFPILYVSVPELDAKPAITDPVISILKDRQREDWRPIRHYDVNSREVKQTVEQFCATISRKLRLPWISLEERQAIEEQRRVEEEERCRIEENRRVQEEHRRQVEAKKQAEEEARQREADRKAEQDRARKEAERLEQRRQREQEETERQERRQRELTAKRKSEEDRRRAENLPATPIIKVAETASQGDDKDSSEPSWLQIVGMFIVIVIFLVIVGGTLFWTVSSLMPPRRF